MGLPNLEYLNFNKDNIVCRFYLEAVMTPGPKLYTMEGKSTVTYCLNVNLINPHLRELSPRAVPTMIA